MNNNYSNQASPRIDQSDIVGPEGKPLGNPSNMNIYNLPENDYLYDAPSQERRQKDGDVGHGDKSLEKVQSKMRVEAPPSQPPVLGSISKPKSLPPLSNTGSSQNVTQSVGQKPLVISTDIKIQPKSHGFPSPAQQFQALPEEGSGQDQSQQLNQKQKQRRNDASVHPVKQENQLASDQSQQNSAIDCLVDLEELKQEKILIQRDKEFKDDLIDDEPLDDDDDVLDNRRLSDHDLSESLALNRDDNKQGDDVSSLSIKDKLELLSANSRPLKVLSSTSYFVHDQILYSLEVKEGLEVNDYQGYDHNLEDYIIDDSNYSLFKNFKNKFSDLDFFQEYNILKMELDQDYMKDFKIESNIQLVLYHLPHFVKIKTINLPLKYLSRMTKLTVSSQSNIQIYSKNIVYFLYLEGKFLDQAQRENLHQSTIQFAGTQAQFNKQDKKNEDRKQKDSENNKEQEDDEGNEDESNIHTQIKIKKYVEYANFNIVYYKPPGSDHILNAAQLGTKGKDLQRLILTKNYWIDSYHLPTLNEYISESDENTPLEMKQCLIMNERAIMVQASSNSEYYILSKDEDKVKMIETNLGKPTDPRKLKKKKDGEKEDIKNQTITFPERTHIGYFIIKHTQNSYVLNSSYKAIRFMKKGSAETIELGTIKSSNLLRMIYNFEGQEDMSIEQLYCDQILQMTFRCRIKQQVYTFDLENQKLLIHNFFSKIKKKYKNQIIIDTGSGSGCGFNSNYEKYLLCFNKEQDEGYVLECLALMRNDYLINDVLKNFSMNQNSKELSVPRNYIEYFTKRSQYGSKQIEHHHIDIKEQMEKLESQASLKKSSSLLKQATFKFSKKSSQILGEEENVDELLAIQQKAQSDQKTQQIKYRLEKEEHLNNMKITSTQYIFDPSVEMLNHLKYQIQMGLVSGLFQQRVAYNYHYDKYETHEEFNYHKMLKCNKDFIWQSHIKKNYLIISKQSTKSTIFQNSQAHKYAQFFTIKLKRGLLIREAYFSDDNSKLIIIYQSIKADNDKWRRDSIIFSLENFSKPMNYHIENIRSIIDFTPNRLCLLQRFSENSTNLISYIFDSSVLRVNANIDITQLLRQDKYQHSYSYNHYKPQSYFHFVYKDKYLLVQLDYSYYMIFDKDTFEFFNTFEFTDKHLYLQYDQGNLYFINNPSNDHRQKEMPQLQFYDGFIDKILRLSIQQLHIVVNLQLQRFIIQDSEYQEVTHIKINFVNQHRIALLHTQNQLTNQMNDHDMVKYINELTMDELVSYYDTYNSGFLHQVWLRNQKVLDSISKRIQQINPRSMPLIFLKDNQNKTILDLAVEFNDYFQINIILDMVIKFQNQTYLNEMVDVHINYMLKHKFNLKEYFLSDLPMQKIQNVNYPSYSKDNSTIIFGDFEDHHTINYIWNSYNELVGREVDESQNRGQVQVEYFFLNIPQAIRNPKFMKNLSSITDLDLYETQAIQTILDYKWETYAYHSALLQFFYFMIYLISFSVDIYLYIIIGPDRDWAQLIVTKIICLIYIGIMERYEISLLFKIGIKSYHEDFWNYGDQIFAMLYIGCVVVDLTSATSDGLVIMLSIMCFFVFIKLCSNLRVFEGFSFQMSMLKAVFYDIRYFISLYAFVIGMYGFIFSLLQISPDGVGVYYQSVSYFGYFIMAFRTSLGDSQVDYYYELSEMLSVFAWLVYITAILLLNIILLNFIIAVIGESYSKVMQRMTAESYKIKCLLIKEQESYFKKRFQNRKYFPKYMILRQATQGSGEDNIDWQGFIKELKKTITTSNQSSANHIKNHVEHLKFDIHERLVAIQKDNTVKQELFEQNIRYHFFEAIKSMQTQQTDLAKKMEEMMKSQNEQRAAQQQMQQRLELGLIGTNQLNDSQQAPNLKLTQVRSQLKGRQSISVYDLPIDSRLIGQNAVNESVAEEDDDDCEATT